MPISQINTNSIANGAVVAADLAAGAALSNLGTSQLARANMPAGSVLQVIQSAKTDTQTFSGLSTSWADITGLSVSITPTSTSSRIYVAGVLYVSSTGNPAQIRMVRNSTPILIGNAASNRKQALSQPWGGGGDLDGFSVSPSFVDSPSTTSAVTYKLQISIGGAATNYVNRTARDADATAEDARSASCIIVMEIAG
jgi:hypothetical protein